ncbi:hypothetical protein HJFPF1_06364 [Paramyrothecium foliicola]|nr:hypothetical protein HJFPF1_06364 [Paramyrothecium foliicola]
MKTVQSLALAAGLASVASAHMEMLFPAPFKSKANPNAGQDIDYSMVDPLAQDGSNFPCKGYHSLFGTPAGAATADFTPGSSYEIKVAGGANHNGGSCQASLSYDKGATWTVIHSYIGNCPVQGESSYPFTVPADAPGGEAIFAWTWFNKVGNREMYMNCAAVNIAGGAAKRQASAAFSSRPSMFVANVGNGCKVPETVDVEFPNPGPDVTTDAAATKGAPEGDCGSAGPAPPTTPEQPPSTPEQPPSTPEQPPSTPEQPPSTPEQPPSTPEQPPSVPEQPPTVPEQPPAQSTSALVPSASPAPTQADPECNMSSSPGGVFITVPPTASTTEAAPVASSSPSTLVTITKTPVAPQPTPGTPTGVPTTPKPTPGAVGAMPAGTACASEGVWNCVDGSQFQRCASGQWSVLQPMAAGLTCVPGQAETLSYKKRAPRGFWWI